MGRIVIIHDDDSAQLAKTGLCYWPTGGGDRRSGDEEEAAHGECQTEEDRGEVGQLLCEGLFVRSRAEKAAANTGRSSY